MRTLIALIVGFSSILCGCGPNKSKTDSQVVSSRDFWKTYFAQNKITYNELLLYIEQNYSTAPQYINELRILFLNCRDWKKGHDLQICDERVIDYMVELNLREISIEREHCKDTDELDTIYFLIGKHGSPSIYFIYSYCETDQYFENSNVKYWPLDDHWAMQFEN